MCSPAAVVNRYGQDVADRFGIPTTYNQPGPGGVFLGSVGDQAHNTRTSSHNCAPNSQESPINGVSYHPDFAHAWDARPSSMEIGLAMVRETLADKRVRYINFADVRYFPDGRTEATDHPTFHVSFLPGTHNDTRPFFANSNDLTEAEVKELTEAIKQLGVTLTGVIQRQGDKTRNTVQRQAILTRLAIYTANDDKQGIETAKAELKNLGDD